MKNFLVLLFLLLFQGLTFGQCWKKLASKYDYVLAIHHDGTLWNWGGPQLNQRRITTPRLLDTNQWLEIATGNQFQAAIRADGTLWAWGDNSYGQLGDGTTTNRWTPTQIGTDTNWMQVSCGYGQTAALKTDGTLWIWGQNNYGQLGLGINRTNRNVPVQLGTDSTWVSISAGRYHTLVQKANNSVWFVGACYNSENSQLHQINAATDWKIVSAGPYIDYGIKQNGTLWKWSQSGGTNTAPVQIGTATDWNKLDNSQAYSQEAHALLIKNNGSLWTIGYNNFGQFGTGTITNSTTTPIQVGSDQDWLEVIGGNNYSLALKTNFTFWAWGRNNHAQFGNGENKNTLLPINTTTTWKMASSGKGSFNSHTLAIQENGTLWAWGQNNDGQLGNGSTYTHQVLPVKIGSDSTWKHVSNGFHFSIGLKTDGSLWGWGRNSRGQLGLGQLYPTQTSPFRVGTDTDWVMTASGSEFVIALKSNGTLWAWGYNFDGQLGDGTTNTIYVPTQIGTDSNWVSISTGENSSLAIKSDSTLWTWGNNGYGQLGRGGNRLVPMQVGTDKWNAITGGGFHTLGIKADSSLWTWGRNLYSQLGNGGSSDQAFPIQIGVGSKWTDITGGYEHSLALRSDHTLWAWGRNGSGQLADTASYPEFLSTTYVPTQVSSQSNWRSIDGGNVNSIAINEDGLLYTCGDAWVSDFQLNFPQLGYIHWLPIQVNSCSYCLPSSSAYSVEVCSGDSVFFNGQYRLTSGTYQDTLLNLSNCDSIVSLNLLVNNPNFGIDVQQHCDSYTWIDGFTYTADNTSATHTLLGASTNGCDSTVTLNLIITYASNGTDIQQACDTYTWIDGNVYTSDTNSAQHIIPGGASNGCDSIVTLNLTMHQSTFGVDHISSCGAYTWIDGMTYASSNQTAVYTLTNASGCDSVVTLDLTVNTIDPTVSQTNFTLTSNESGVQYQWLDCASGFAVLVGEQAQSYQVSANGSYAVEITKNGCSDTSACVLVSNVGINEVTESNRITLYPNPTDGLFYIGFDQVYEQISCSVRDIQGREIRNEMLVDTQVHSVFLDEPAGVYFVCIRLGEQTELILKLIKE